MIQLYFLSIFCNGLAGYVLFTDSNDGIKKPYFSVSNPLFYLVLGIISAVVGVLKLISPLAGADGSATYVIGDLVPAAAGIITGIIFIFGIYRHESSFKSAKLEQIGTNLLVFRKSIGIALMAVAILHFLFGELVFL
ncbi:MAG: hypothetical protein FWC97_05960 [Treponema sp.]|nr:hypothetical protein [Treponema sp.]